MSRERAARHAGMGRQTLRSIRSGRREPDPVGLIEGVIRFNAEGVPGLRDRSKSGPPEWLDEGQLAAFKAVVLRGARG